MNRSFFKHSLIQCLTIGPLCLVLMACNDDVEHQVPIAETPVEERPVEERPSESIIFSAQVLHLVPGEQVLLNSGVESAASKSSFSTTQSAYATSQEIEVIVIEGDGYLREYFDFDNIYAPDLLGDFTITAYGISNEELEQSVVDTDSKLVDIEVVNTNSSEAMDRVGGVNSYIALGSFDVFGDGSVLVTRDVSLSVNWHASGNVRPLDNALGGYYFDGEGSANIEISYGDLIQEMETTVAAAIPVSSMSVTVGGQTYVRGQELSLPGNGSYELSTRLFYQDGTDMEDETFAWALSGAPAGVSINDDQLNIQDNDIDFTLNGYLTSVVDGKVERNASPELEIEVSVEGLDMTVSGIELQLDRAVYRIGDKLAFTVYEDYNSGLTAAMSDLSAVSLTGPLIDSNSLGEVSVVRAGTGSVTAVVDIDGNRFSSSVDIEVVNTRVENLTLQAVNTNVDNYLVSDNGYPFYIYNQLDSGAAEPCSTCTLIVTNDVGDTLGSGYYSVELTSKSADLELFQPGTYYVKAVSENRQAESAAIEVTVPNNPMSSLDINIGSTVSTYLGGSITPTATITYQDGQTRAASSVQYSYTTSDGAELDIQGSTLYPTQPGTIELTAQSNGLTVSKTVALQVEYGVTITDATIKYRQRNSGGELVLDAYHKPYLQVQQSNGDIVNYAYEDVSWTIKSSELAYKQTLDGFKFEYDAAYDGDWAYTEFVASIYFNGELYEAEDRISIDSRITSGVWISLYDYNKPDPFKVGETISLAIRRGFHQDEGTSIYYDFLLGTRAAPRNSHVKIVSESGFTTRILGQSAGTVIVDFYSQYGEYLASETYIVENP